MAMNCRDFIYAASATAAYVGRIMFSVDHPYGLMSEARDFLDRRPVSAADRGRVAHGNAERLFNI
jgi:hypothetical protein